MEGCRWTAMLRYHAEHEQGKRKASDRSFGEVGVEGASGRGGVAAGGSWPLALAAGEENSRRFSSLVFLILLFVEGAADHSLALAKPLAAPLPPSSGPPVSPSNFCLSPLPLAHSCPRSPTLAHTLSFPPPLLAFLIAPPGPLSPLSPLLPGALALPRLALAACCLHAMPFRRPDPQQSTPRPGRQRILTLIEPSPDAAR